MTDDSDGVVELRGKKEADVHPHHHHTSRVPHERGLTGGVAVGGRGGGGVGSAALLGGGWPCPPSSLMQQVPRCDSSPPLNMLHTTPLSSSDDRLRRSLPPCASRVALADCSALSRPPAAVRTSLLLPGDELDCRRRLPPASLEGQGVGAVELVLGDVVADSGRGGVATYR